MELEMSSPTTSFAELLYINPDGKASYCFNSKLSQARIRVNPVDEAPFEYITPHGGALEFLKPRDCV
ncbi:MAG: hypothetical protein HY559_04690 [Gammaproteobacteria bacterium]|nr:hypothetical protein [Gammaproteobacteria bacterium]